MTPGQILFSQLAIDEDRIPLEYLNSYIAVEYYLTTEDEPPKDTSQLAKMQRYLDSMLVLAKMHNLEAVKLILNYSINLEEKITMLLPIKDRFLSNGNFNMVIETSDEILQNFAQYLDSELDYIWLWKGQALQGMGKSIEAYNIFTKISQNQKSTIENRVYAKVCLLINQTQRGIYKIEDLQNFLSDIESQWNGIDSRKREQYEIAILEQIAYHEMNHGRYDHALKFYDRALKIISIQGEIYQQIPILCHRGVIYRRKQEYEKAIQSLEDALEKSLIIENEVRVGWIKHHLAWTYLNKGEYDCAYVFCQESLKMYKEIQDLRGVSDCYEQLGLIQIAKRQLNDAYINLKQSLEIRNNIKNLHGSASSLKNLAVVSWHQKKYIKFLQYLIRSFIQYYKIGVLNQNRILRMVKFIYVWIFGKRTWTT
ncbi:tetratricopeptide repeat protein [Roseofilum casamattae]|nr:tetratricopeptide repeat protein [Roseofilum casamattae]